MEHENFLVAVSDLIQKIVHDYNNQLTPIEGNVSLIKAKTQDPSILEDLSDIEDALKSIYEYRKMLKRFYSDKIATQSVFKLNDIINKYCEKYKSLLNITVELIGDFEIKADESEIEFLIDELFNNTFIHCGHKTHVYIRVFREGNSIVMIYEDRGKGVEDKFRIFVPFYSTLPSRKGLGLSYVWGITRRHSIHFEIETKLNNYLRFTFKFPSELKSL